MASYSSTCVIQVSRSPVIQKLIWKTLFRSCNLPVAAKLKHWSVKGVNIVPFFAVFLCFKTSAHLLRRNAVFLWSSRQKCFVYYEISSDFPSAHRWVDNDRICFFGVELITLTDFLQDCPVALATHNSAYITVFTGI